MVLVYKKRDGPHPTGNYGNNDLAGVPTAVAGFASVFGDKLGSLILAVGLLLFATSTILGWALYGTRCAEFLFGSKIIRPYQVLFCLVVIAGSAADLKLVWGRGPAGRGSSRRWRRARWARSRDRPHWRRRRGRRPW